MGFLDNLLNRYRDRRDEEFSNASDEIINWESFMTSILSTEGLIERSSYVGQLSMLYGFAADAERLYNKLVIFADDTVSDFRALFRSFQLKVNSFESDIDVHNTVYLKGLITEGRNVIGKIEDHALDDQQMICILKDAHSHNVVAGAGTGKTTTIIGKVKYLINTGKYKSNEILVLSYTHAAAAEMKTRLKRNTSFDITVSRKVLFSCKEYYSVFFTDHSLYRYPQIPRLLALFSPLSYPHILSPVPGRVRIRTLKIYPTEAETLQKECPCEE